MSRQKEKANKNISQSYSTYSPVGMIRPPQKTVRILQRISSQTMWIGFVDTHSSHPKCHFCFDKYTLLFSREYLSKNKTKISYTKPPSCKAVVCRWCNCLIAAVSDGIHTEVGLRKLSRAGCTHYGLPGVLSVYNVLGRQ